MKDFKMNLYLHRIIFFSENEIHKDFFFFIQEFYQEMEKKGRTRLWTTHKDLCYLFYNSLWSFSHKFDCYGLTPKKKMNKIVDFIPAGGWLHIQSVYLWRTEKKNNGIVQVGYLNWYSKCNTRSHTFFSVITNAMQLSLLLSAYMNFMYVLVLPV